MALVRFFAAAKASTGVAEASFASETLASLIEELPARFSVSASEAAPPMRELLARCSFLVRGARVDQTEAAACVLTDADVVDVLPPFAGG